MPASTIHVAFALHASSPAHSVQILVSSAQLIANYNCSDCFTAQTWGRQLCDRPRLTRRYVTGLLVENSRLQSVAYLLTEHIRTYNPQTRGFGTFPPHIMFYAPNLTSSCPKMASLPFFSQRFPYGNLPKTYGFWLARATPVATMPLGVSVQNLRILDVD
jgi:hypothetical protein